MNCMCVCVPEYVYVHMCMNPQTSEEVFGIGVTPVKQFCRERLSRWRRPHAEVRGWASGAKEPTSTSSQV